MSALAARRWACARLIGSAVVIAVGLGESRTTFVSGTKGRAFRGATLIRRCRTLVTDGRSASPRSPIGAALYRWRSAPEPTGVRGSRRLAFGPEAPGSIPRRRRSGSHQPPDLWVDVATGTRPVHSPLFVMSAEYGQVASEASSAGRTARLGVLPSFRARPVRRHRSGGGRPGSQATAPTAWARMTTSTRSRPGTDRTRPGTAQANPSPNGVPKPEVRVTVGRSAEPSPPVPVPGISEGGPHRERGSGRRIGARAASTGQVSNRRPASPAFRSPPGSTTAGASRSPAVSGSRSSAAWA